MPSVTQISIEVNTMKSTIFLWNVGRGQAFLEGMEGYRKAARVCQRVGNNGHKCHSVDYYLGTFQNNASS